MLLSKATYSAFRLYLSFFFISMCSLGIEPTTLCTANTMLYHWATGTATVHLDLKKQARKSECFYFNSKLYNKWSVRYFDLKLHRHILGHIRLDCFRLWQLDVVREKYLLHLNYGHLSFKNAWIRCVRDVLLQCVYFISSLPNMIQLTPV